MNKLRSRLEAYKSAIDITLDMISMYVFLSFYAFPPLAFNGVTEGGRQIFNSQLT